MAKEAAAPAAEAPQAEPINMIVAETAQDRYPLGSIQHKAEEQAQEATQEAAEDEFRGDEGEDDGDDVDVEEEQPRDEHGRFRTKGQTLRDRLAAEARERQAERQRADRLEAMLAQVLGANGQPQAQEQQAPIGPPNPDDYPAGQFDPAYIQAAMDFRVEQALEARERQAAHARQQEYLVAAEQQFAQAVPDYIEAKQALLMDPMIANHPGIGQAIMASKNPAPLLYALGKNIEVASNIARMNPIQAAVAIGKVEAYIESQMQQTTQPAPRQAPAPIKPIGSGTRGAGNSDPLKAQSFAEFKRLREEQESKRMGKR